MKKYLFSLFLLVSVSLSAQNIAFDMTFINAEDPGLYDSHLKTYFQPVNQRLIDDGRILGWHVWKVVDTAQADYTHLAVTVYDMDKMDDDYDWSWASWTKRLPNLTEAHAREIAEMINDNRKIVFQTQMVNVAEVLQPGVTTYPDIAVLNFMKVKDGKSKSYENMEKSFTKSIAKGSPRKGWSLAKRVENFGTDIAWTHFTVDWYDKYSDYLKVGARPSSDAGSSYKGITKLRDLRYRVAFNKFIFLNAE
jgi:hypothetical protein